VADETDDVLLLELVEGVAEVRLLDLLVLAQLALLRL